MNPYTHSPIDQHLINDLMVQIPKGSVDMRDDRINKEWREQINPFLLSKFPVTQDLYYAVSGENPSTFRALRLPVETVSWIESIVFCNKLSKLHGFASYYKIEKDVERIDVIQKANGFRLPTEAEWQYSCQAGSKEFRYGDLEKIAWYKKNSNDSTQEVGNKEPNAWELYDMLGNVWEWCSDIYDATVYGTYRIFRGGGWCDEERSIMATNRRRSHPNSFRIDDLGFRIARNLD